MNRKLRAAAIFSGEKFLPSNTVLVLREDGTVEDVLLDDAIETEYCDGILCPGFVNAHCHTELSHLHGAIPQNTGLPRFVEEVMAQRNRFGGEEVQQKIRGALDALWENGVVAVGDICNGTDSIRHKKTSPLYFRNFVETSGFVPETAAKRFAGAEAVKKVFDDELPQSPALVVPHAPYSVSHRLYNIISAAAPDGLLSIHNEESEEELKLYQGLPNGFGGLYRILGIHTGFFEPPRVSPFAFWLRYFHRGQTMLSVHNTFLQQSDIDFYHSLADRPQLYFCLCPNANLFIENRLPPVDMMVGNGLDIVLGTDSLASNHRLSIAAEINQIVANFPNVPLEKILFWATLNGAKALGMESRFGSFEKGKRPGALLLKKEGGGFVAHKV